ncbi:MAG TPA: GNAT family N-acetyltransferase [Allosphingosinicella sp.]|nr:GNAT family N-acetyltransferase [Allosphingosinicella sp.]
MYVDLAQAFSSGDVTASAPPRVEVAQLSAIPDSWDEAWDELAAKASEPNPFAERWFTAPGAKHLLEDEGARMIAVWGEHAGNAVLLGLLAVVVAARYGRLPLRHVENWLHHNVFLGTPLVRRGREAEFWSAALAALDSAPWARGFFHLSFLGEGGPVHRGLIASAGRLGRRCDIVARRERALLASELSPEAYYGKALRTKKRKELRRQKARLGELGDLTFSTLERSGDAEAWCEDFLRLERSGWKGETGSALAADGRTESFFRDAFRSGFDAGRLEAIRLCLDGRPIAMLVNFITPPGAFSFKTAIDEEYGRFSPGILLQIENYRMLGRTDVAWTDSCAREFNAMINAMWTERRSIVRVSVPLAGARRRAVFEAARLAENGAALIGRLRRGAQK